MPTISKNFPLFICTQNSPLDLQTPVYLSSRGEVFSRQDKSIKLGSIIYRIDRFAQYHDLDADRLLEKIDSLFQRGLLQHYTELTLRDVLKMNEAGDSFPRINPRKRKIDQL